MNKKLIDNFLELNSFTLPNGFKVYIFKTDDNILEANLFVKYGSLNRKFIVDGKKYTTNRGIAHFLEHKMFEKKNMDITEEFSKLGTDSNAYTSYDETCYYFRCNNNYERNIELLLELVGEPYFTDSNVSKEKGIIKEEINMIESQASEYFVRETFKNVFYKTPLFESIDGSSEDIELITKEELELCYNTFYVPNNMILIIKGNIDENIVKNIVENSKIGKKESKIIEKNKEEESPEVRKEYSVIYHKTEPDVEANYTYKISYKDFSDLGLDRYTIKAYIKAFFSMKIGYLSLFSYNSDKYKWSNSYYEYVLYSNDDYVIMNVGIRSRVPDKFVLNLEKEIDNKKIKEIDFNRYIKSRYIGYLELESNKLDYASRIIDPIIDYGKIFEPKTFIKSLSFDMLKKVVKRLDLSNHSFTIILPEDNND